MMNCFEFRRLVLIDPRAHPLGQELHLAGCAKCASFAHAMEGFEARIHDAMHVPVPEGLAERVLLRRQILSSRRWSMLALAATFLLTIGVTLHFAVFSDRRDAVPTAERLGADHAALAAISYVLDHEPQLLKENRAGDPKVMRAALSRIGLSLPADIGSVRYLGKCPVSPGGTGEHVVLQTPFGHVTLILVPDQLFASRIVVSDRDMSALAAPMRSGSYILIADSPQTLKRVEALII